MPRIIFYDLETSGLNPSNDKIIEIGAIDNNNNTFSKLINPELEISSKIEEITNIKNSKLKYRNTIEQSYDLIQDWFDFNNKEIYLVAHNGDNFDLKFLQKHFTIYCKHIDTLTLFRKLLPTRNSHSLKTLCNIYNIDLKNHHRALDDSIMLKKLYFKAVELYSIIYDCNIEDVTPDIIYDYLYTE